MSRAIMAAVQLAAREHGLAAGDAEELARNIAAALPAVFAEALGHRRARLAIEVPSEYDSAPGDDMFAGRVMRALDAMAIAAEETYY